MNKIERSSFHHLNQSGKISIQDLTMLSRLNPRINTLKVEQLANSLKHLDQDTQKLPLLFEAKKSSLPVRFWKWLTGDKNRLKIIVKRGDEELLHFFAKSVSQAKREIKIAHLLNAIAQSVSRKEKQVTIHAAEAYIRRHFHNDHYRKNLLQIIQKVTAEALKEMKPEEGKKNEPLMSHEVQHLEALLERIKTGESNFEHEKITLSDLAKLLELEKAPQEIQPKNLKKTLDELRKLVKEQTLLQNGDIGLTDIDKKNILDGEEINRLERLFKTVLQTPYLHAQMFIKGKIHHIVQDYRESEASLKLQAQCAFLRIHPEELLNDNLTLIEALKKKYGDNYRAAIEAKFRTIQESLHNTLSEPAQGKGEGRFTKVRNSFKHMMKTGLAHWFYPLQKRVRRSTKEFETAHIRVYGKAPLQKAKYHCTEFVAEVTLATLFELDKQLKSELGAEFADTPIIRFPFSERERVRFLDPARLISELKKCGAITQVPPNPVLVELFKQQDLNWGDPELFSGLVSRPASLKNQKDGERR